LAKKGCGQISTEEKKNQTKRTIDPKHVRKNEKKKERKVRGELIGIQSKEGKRR